jgi:hypothetical protein
MRHRFGTTMTLEELIQEIEEQKGLMIDVATGRRQIQDVNEAYIARRERIKHDLAERSIRDPNGFTDLWRWYERWKKGDLPSYQSRRIFIADLYDPLLEQLRGLAAGQLAPPEPTGWPRVDRVISDLRQKVDAAENEEEFQAIGLLCREALISLSQLIYDADRHRTLDGIRASETDAKRMLEAYLAVELAGGPNEEARRHAKAALDLAVALQHRRTATFRDAALCAEATTAVVNLVAIISGKRDR